MQPPKPGQNHNGVGTHQIERLRCEVQRGHGCILDGWLQRLPNVPARMIHPIPSHPMTHTKKPTTTGEWGQGLLG